MILNYQDQSDNVSSMTKTRQNNNVINCTYPLYIENEIELSWSIQYSTVYDEY